MKPRGKTMLAAHPRPLTESDAEAIVEMAERRAELVRHMRAALEAHEDALALELARKVAGLDEAA